jgi:hypothetical protein
MIEKKDYQVFENLLGRLQYVVSSNRKVFTRNTKYKKIEDTITSVSNQ